MSRSQGTILGGHMPRPFSYSLRKRYEQFVYELTAAHEIMKSGNDDGRAGLRFACQAAVNFLYDTGALPESANAFDRLKNGFDELKEGRRPRFFSRNTDLGKRQK